MHISYVILQLDCNMNWIACQLCHIAAVKLQASNFISLWFILLSFKKRKITYALQHCYKKKKKTQVKSLHTGKVPDTGEHTAKGNYYSPCLIPFLFDPIISSPSYSYGYPQTSLLSEHILKIILCFHIVICIGLSVYPLLHDFSKNGTNSEFIAVHAEWKIKSLLDYMQKLTQLSFKMAIYLLNNISIIKQE